MKKVRRGSAEFRQYAEEILKAGVKIWQGYGWRVLSGVLTYEQLMETTKGYTAYIQNGEMMFIHPHGYQIQKCRKGDC